MKFTKLEISKSNDGDIATGQSQCVVAMAYHVAEFQIMIIGALPRRCRPQVRRIDMNGALHSRNAIPWRLTRGLITVVSPTELTARGSSVPKNAKLLISERREWRGLEKPWTLAHQVSSPANAEQGMTSLAANDATGHMTQTEG